MFRRYRLSIGKILFSGMFSISSYVSPDNQIRKKAILFKQLLTNVHELQLKKENKFLYNHDFQQ